MRDGSVSADQAWHRNAWWVEFMCRIVCCAVLRLQLQAHRTSFFIFVPPCRSHGLPHRGDVGRVMEVSGVKASLVDAEDGEAAAITKIDGLIVQKQRAEVVCQPP